MSIIISFFRVNTFFFSLSRDSPRKLTVEMSSTDPKRRDATPKNVATIGRATLHRLAAAAQVSRAPKEWNLDLLFRMVWLQRHAQMWSSPSDGICSDRKNRLEPITNSAAVLQCHGWQKPDNGKSCSPIRHRNLMSAWPQIGKNPWMWLLKYPLSVMLVRNYWWSSLTHSLNSLEIQTCPLFVCFAQLSALLWTVDDHSS